MVTRKGLDVGDMASYLGGFDLVCQPSRAEGFGLVPLEARACGVPVAATLCTGHADHMAASEWCWSCPSCSPAVPRPQHRQPLRPLRPELYL